MDPLPIWEAEFEKVSPDLSSPNGVVELGKYIAERVDGKLSLDQSQCLFTPLAPFRWQKEIFVAQILSLSQFSTDPITPRIQFALAWQTATLAVLPFLLAGAKMNPPPPATNGISAIGTAIINPAGVAQGFAVCQKKLLEAPNAASAAASKIPEAVRSAFEKVTYSATGIDTSLPPPAGIGPVPYAFPLLKVQ